MSDDTQGGIKVILTSPRVAPGLLTRAAWQAFADADDIGAAGVPTRPDVQAVVGSGLRCHPGRGRRGRALDLALRRSRLRPPGRLARR